MSFTARNHNSRFPCWRPSCEAARLRVTLKTTMAMVAALAIATRRPFDGQQPCQLGRMETAAGRVGKIRINDELGPALFPAQTLKTRLAFSLKTS